MTSMRRRNRYAINGKLTDAAVDTQTNYIMNVLNLLSSSLA